jgi:glycerate 2-kinase
VRVLIAPDKFAGTLTAAEAASAIAEGWLRHAPTDQLDLCPMADGGPGFVSVLHANLGGELVPFDVTGPLGKPTTATMLKCGEVYYLESAQACGREQSNPRRAEQASTFGVGQLVKGAVEAGATKVVIGLGGSATTDGGSGLLAALGATAQSGNLCGGAVGLQEVSEVDLTAAQVSCAGVQLFAATDVDNPLTGLFGAAKTFGAQKGIAEDRIPTVDAWLERWSHATDRRVSLQAGAGAAGGLGHALLMLGATLVPGVRLVGEVVQLASRAGSADLVVTGEGAFDFSSRSGKVPYGVAEVATNALRPCIALAGQVLIGGREMRALGIESAYSLVDFVGEDRAFQEPAQALCELAERVARTWSR